MKRIFIQLFFTIAVVTFLPFSALNAAGIMDELNNDAQAETPDGGDDQATENPVAEEGAETPDNQDAAIDDNRQAEEQSPQTDAVPDENAQPGENGENSQPADADAERTRRT